MSIVWRFVAFTFLFCLALPLEAQDKPIRIVLGFPPGASSDTLARLIAERLRVSLDQPVIVENKPGAGGIVANEAVKAAPADGGTILLTPQTTMVVYPHTFAKLRYDPFTDFTPIAQLTQFPLALGVAASVPANTVAEYVAWIRRDVARNGFYASASAGSMGHFFGVMFGRASGIAITHVPYKGTAPVLAGLASGEISAAFLPLSDMSAFERAGKARLLAVSGARRSPYAAQVPSFKELGFDIEGTAWYALYAPAGLPRNLLSRYSRAAIDAVRSGDLGQRLASLGLEPTGLGPEDLARIQKEDFERWGPVVRASGFQSD
jgi:tripartite-type tricarboxylate transporter receptor subunit TctC